MQREQGGLPTRVYWREAVEVSAPCAATVLRARARRAHHRGMGGARGHRAIGRVVG